MSNSDVILSQIRQRLEILYQMVDELEAGGGGGGGTTNYNDLTNKPSIAGVQLTGNKTASDLSLATPSDITLAFAPSTISLEEGGTFPSASRSLLADHKPLNVNDEQYYFLEETGVDYLYGSMPTSGAYPSLSYLRIMKSSYAVEFHNTGIDTVPTEDSDHLITSGAVYSAIQGGGGGADLTPTYVGAKAATFPEEYMSVLAKHLPFTDTTSFGPTSGAFGPWTFYSECASVYVYISVGVTNDIPYGALKFKMATINKVNRTWTELTNAQARYPITRDVLNNETWEQATENISSTSANLNDYGAGRYYSSVDPTNFVNCPTTDRFFLTAEGNGSTGSNSRVKQTLTTLSSTNPPTVYIRTNIGGTWGSWYKFEGTVVS